MNNKNLKIIEVDTDNGEIPQYVEVLANNRSKIIKYLKKNGVDVRIFYPNLSNNFLYGKKNRAKFKNSEKFEKKGLYLPSGPDQTPKDINKVINLINKF